ncbi:unnamed protein product, partial [Symbiodinium pilosum]
LLWPLYSIFLQACTVYGHWRCLLYYIPFFPMRHGLYTEGQMDAEALWRLHGIHCLQEEDASQLPGHPSTDKKTASPLSDVNHMNVFQPEEVEPFAEDCSDDGSEYEI